MIALQRCSFKMRFVRQALNLESIQFVGIFFSTARPVEVQPEDFTGADERASRIRCVEREQRERGALPLSPPRRIAVFCFSLRALG